jgi:sugar lactone lactonase YvrE
LGIGLLLVLTFSQMSPITGVLSASEPPPLQHSTAAGSSGPTVVKGNFSYLKLDPLRPRLYLSDVSSKSIVVLNTTDDEQIASINLGYGPLSMDISADGQELYVALLDAEALAVVNLTTLKLSEEILLSIWPGEVCAGRLGRAYVVETDEIGEGWNYPVVVDTNASRQIGKITSGGLIFNGDLCLVSPDRQTLYIGDRDQGPSTIYKFSVKADNVSLVSKSPFDNDLDFIKDMALSPDGSRLYVAAASMLPDGITIFNSTDWTLIGRLETSSPPTSVALVANGSLAFAAHWPYPSEVSMFNTSTLADIANFATLRDNGAPFFVRVNPDGSRVYVLDASMWGSENGQLEVFDIHATNATVSCTSSEVSLGNTIHCTATVMGHLTNPTGVVNWSETGTGGLALSSKSCALPSTQCEVNATGIADGMVTLNVTYSGDTTHYPSSAELSVWVYTPTNTTVTCAPSRIVGNRSTSCTAAVNGNSPTGAVTWWSSSYSGTFYPSSCTLASGLCSVSYSPSSTGRMAINAVYGGDSDNGGSYGMFLLAVGPALTTAVSCTPSSFGIGHTSSCTATVSGGLSPSGTVTFSQSGNGSVTLPDPPTCALSSGSCSVTVTGATLGSVSITATYGGDGVNPSSVGSLPLAVVYVLATCTRSSVVVGASVTCRSTVFGTSPSGVVAWSSSSSGVFSKTSCLLSRHRTYGTCSVKYKPTAAGSVMITANYGGDSKNSASAGEFNLVVTPKATTTMVSCSPTSAVAGSSKVIICKAKVTGYLPTGTVSWSQTGTGSVSLTSTTCTLASLTNPDRATCSVTMTGTTAGKVTVLATYVGGPNNEGSYKTAKLKIKP